MIVNVNVEDHQLVVLAVPIVEVPVTGDSLLRGSSFFLKFTYFLKMKIYKCDKCGNEYKTKNGLKKHRRSNHGFLIFIKKYKWIFRIVIIIPPILIFYFSYKPEVRVEKMSYEQMQYIVYVKNYGKSTAKNIKINMKHISAGGQGAIIESLPAQTSIKHTFPIFPLFNKPDSFRNAPEVLNQYLKLLQEYEKGEKGLVTYVNIKYKWGIMRYNSPTYIVHLNKDIGFKYFETPYFEE